MKNSTIVVIIAVIIILGAAGWYVMSRSGSSSPTTQTPVAQQTGDQTQSTGTPSASTSTTPASTGAVTTASVTLGSNGFSPATVTVKKGSTVTWTNGAGGGMWVAVDEHPTHTEYAGTTRSAHCPDTSGSAFDQCTVGNTYSFTFNKVGTWEYHNHVNAGQIGKVIVVE